MRVTSHPDLILDGAEDAFPRAADDVRDEARRRAAAHSRTGKWAGSIIVGDIDTEGDRMTTLVGSTLVSARAHELGAYIEAKRRPRLYFDAGRGVRTPQAVRLAPQPAVIPAGRRFSEYMDRRLIEALR